MEKSTLLILNDHCLMEIFKFLEDRDCINLAKTCHRLRNDAVSAIALKYKELALQVSPTINSYSFSREYDAYPNKKTMAELIDTLSLIGEKALSLKFIGTIPSIHKILRKVPNLKELKLDKDFVTSHLSDYFSKNNQLESLECQYENGVFKLLKMLPNLTGLRLAYDLPDRPDLNETFNDIFCLNGLTKFSLAGHYNCNQLLIKLAKNLKLLELDIHACMDEHTFDIIKSFENLERLSMKNRTRLLSVPENVVLPPQLKCIKFGGIEISCDCFLSVVKNLKLLYEFDIGDGYIVENEGKLLKLIIEPCNDCLF